MIAILAILAQIADGDFGALFFKLWTLCLSHNWYALGAGLLVALMWTARYLLAKRFPFFAKPLMLQFSLVGASFAWTIFAAATDGVAGFVLSGPVLFAALKVAFASAAGKELVQRLINVGAAKMGIAPKASVQLIEIAAQKNGTTAAEMVQRIEPQDVIKDAP
jgi:hypothetical protein